MTRDDFVRAYRRNGRLKRAAAKELAKQLRSGVLASADFVGLVPFPVLEDAYRRFGDRFPLKYAAWTVNATAGLKHRPAVQKLPAQGQGNPVAVPVTEVQANQGGI